MSLLAQRYAQALFKVATSQNSVEAVALDINDIQNMIQGSRELRLFLSNPLLSKEYIHKIFELFFKKTNFSSLTQEFLIFLARQKRLKNLADILKSFQKIHQQFQKHVTVKITSAHPLSQEQRLRLKTVLERKTAQEVIFDETIDPQIIGGMIIEMGEYRIDSTLQTRFIHLENKIRGL